MKKRHYSPQEKSQALRSLQEHEGDISHVSTLLNIPERTLYTWRKDYESLNLHEKSIPQNLQNQRNQQNPELPPLELSAFGMTREQLAKALEIEYIPSPFNTMRENLWTHIKILQTSISEDPDTAHVRALAVSRMLDDILRLDAICRLEKPNLNIIKYEYRDGTYHNIPEWNNLVYGRADQAYWAVLIQARREYYALKGQVYDEQSYPDQADDLYPTLAQLAEMHFTADDFIPKARGIHAWLEERQSQAFDPNPADYGFYDDDNSY